MLFKLEKTFLKTILKATLIVSLFLQSCSGNDSAERQTTETAATNETANSSSTNTIEACSLITEEEAKTILGAPVTKGMNAATMCQYVSASDELSKAGESVSIQLQPGAASEFENYVASMEKDLGVKTKPVTGVGDKAVFAEGQLLVSTGKDFIIVVIGRKMNEDEQITAEKNLALKAIERLR